MLHEIGRKSPVVVPIRITMPKFAELHVRHGGAE
jgi:hypothetical protein